MNSSLAIGIDLGATQIKGVVLNSHGEILRQEKMNTDDMPAPEGEQAWMTSVKKMVQELQSDHSSPLPVGLAAPGIPNHSNTAILSMPGRMHGLENLVWAQYLKLPQVPVLNDAVAALLAEHHWGAGQGFQHLALITLGTGIGGGLLLNGGIYQGFLQRAGHLGHLTVNSESEYQGISGIPGNLEDAIGNSTVSRRSLGRYTNTHDLVRDYLEGDTFATWLWLTSVRKLAIGMCAICNAFSPECIVLGGGITQAGDALFDPLNTFMELYEWRPAGQQVEIRKAHFSEYAGALGAAAYALTCQGLKPPAT